MDTRDVLHGRASRCVRDPRSVRNPSSHATPDACGKVILCRNIAARPPRDKSGAPCGRKAQPSTQPKSQSPALEPVTAVVSASSHVFHQGMCVTRAHMGKCVCGSRRLHPGRRVRCYGAIGDVKFNSGRDASHGWPPELEMSHFIAHPVGIRTSIAPNRRRWDAMSRKSGHRPVRYALSACRKHENGPIATLSCRARRPH